MDPYKTCCWLWPLIQDHINLASCSLLNSTLRIDATCDNTTSTKWCERFPAQRDSVQLQFSILILWINRTAKQFIVNTNCHAWLENSPHCTKWMGTSRNTFFWSWLEVHCPEYLDKTGRSDDKKFLRLIWTLRTAAAQTTWRRLSASCPSFLCCRDEKLRHNPQNRLGVLSS